MGGTIVFGYPGVGKTTVAKEFPSCIDLDSSLFNMHTQHYLYTDIAINIARQNKTVFVSTHENILMRFKQPIVRSQLKEWNINCYIVCPYLDQKDEWEERLLNRWKRDKTQANLKAYVRCLEHFESDITKLHNQKDFDVIHTMNFV